MVRKYINQFKRAFKSLSKEEIKALKEEHEDSFIRSGAVAVGYDDEGLVIFTDKDIPYLNSYSLSKVKVIKVDSFKAYNRTAKIRPLQGSISIGHEKVTAGTLSLVVQEKTSGEFLLLSNNHVFANTNKAQVGDRIYQPGKYDGGTEVVGTLYKFIKLENGATVDAALAKPTAKYLTGIWNLPPTVNGWKDPSVGMPVKKYGRSTDATFGSVTAIGVTVNVDYDGTTYTLKDCFICKMGGAPGDSGSPILEQGSNKVVGILFAGGGGYIVGCKISNIMSLLNIDIPFDRRDVILDISKWNGRILDVNKMKENNVIGVIVKCTQGDYTKDSKFEEFWQILKDAKIPVSCYIFVDPKVSAEAHFEFFRKSFGDKIPDFPVALDCEFDNGQSKEKITSVIQKLAQLLEEWLKQYNLHPPLIYTRGSWWNVYVNRWSGWSRYGLWVARYGTDLPWFGEKDSYRPLDWARWELWQFSADGNFEGKLYGLESNHVDKNIATAEFKQKYLSGTPTPPPPEPEYKYKGTILVDNLRVRKAPNISAPIVGYLRKGETVGIESIVLDTSSNKWVKLGLDKFSAFVYNGNKYIEVHGLEDEPSSRKGRVVVNILNVRDKPMGAVIGKLYYGNIINIFEEVKVGSDIWIKIGENKYCAMLFNGQRYVQYV
jgi:GH25 family lysozyme M1 (1,4-beta-N-acetylmuramidase)